MKKSLSYCAIGVLGILTCEPSVAMMAEGFKELTRPSIRKSIQAGQKRHKTFDWNFNWKEAASVYPKPIPYRYDLLPYVSDLAQEVYKLKSAIHSSDRTVLAGNIDDYLEKTYVALYTYKDPNKLEEWVHPKAYDRLLQYYQYFLMELPHTLEKIATASYTLDATPHFTEETLPVFLDKVFFLFDQHNNENGDNPNWISFRKHPYHQLAQVIELYPELNKSVQACKRYRSFLKTYANILAANDSELKPRTKRKEGPVFGGPETNLDYFKHIAKSRKGLPESSY